MGALNDCLLHVKKIAISSSEFTVDPTVMVQADIDISTQFMLNSLPTFKSRAMRLYAADSDHKLS